MGRYQGVFDTVKRSTRSLLTSFRAPPGTIFTVLLVLCVSGQLMDTGPYLHAAAEMSVSNGAGDIGAASDADSVEPGFNKGSDIPAVYHLDCFRLLPGDIINRSEFRRISMVSIPGPVTADTIEQTVDSLMKTRKLKQVTWRMERTSAGLCLVFEMERSPYIDRLVFSGNSQMSYSALRYASDLRKFGPFSSELLSGGLAQLEDYYESNGFPVPGLSPTITGPDDSGAVDVVIEIREKQLPKPVSIDFVLTGNPGMIWNIRLKTVLRFLERRIRKNGLNLVKLKNRLKKEERLLRRNGYQNAELTLQVTDSDDENGLFVQVMADVGNPVRITFENVGFLTRRDILAGWKRKHAALTPVELDRLARETRDRLRNEGWLDADVKTVIDERDTVTRARIQAIPGRRHHVEQVVSRGITPVAEKNLPRITGLYPPRLLGLWKTRPGPETLEKAEKALQTHLEMQGYQRSRGDLTLSGLDTRGVTVEVEAFPGPYQLTGAVSIEGVEGIDRTLLFDIADTFLVSPGRPVVNRRIRDVMTAMTRLYWEHGYSDMTIRTRTRRSETTTDITFVIDEGPGYRQGPLIIAGNVKTRSGLIYRLEKIARDDPFTLEKIGLLQEAMYQTGVFDTVTIRTIKHPDASPPYQAVIMDVSERSTGEFETGIDFNTDRGFEGIVEIGERNLFGRSLHGKLSGLLGEKRYGISLSFQRPVFGGYRLENRFRANWSDDRTNTGYDLRKLRFEIGAVRRWRNDISLNVTYALEREWVRNIDPDVTDQIEIGDTRYGSLTPVLTIDRRDDPFRSTRGWVFQMRFKSSLDTFGTQSEFFRWDQDARVFMPIDNDRIVIGFALRAGKAWVLRNSILPAGERFFLGGASTNRGFDHQMCGPLGDDRTPLGGLSFLLANLEARFHLAGNWKAAVFIDAGNVFSESPESPYARPSAGFGLRYETPVGPIRGDIGWNLDRQPGEPAYVIQFALGHAF
jgi:outer membrane protein assembly complex protein YaeT